VDGIAGIKSAMMGPLAGIGDSIFWLTLRPILGGIAASLALQMNPIAPILFFVVLNTVHLLVHWNMTKYGFLAGDRLLEKLDSAETKALMFSATMVGLLSLGALTGTWLNITTPLSYTLGDSTTTVQAMLDAIMPKMLPFLFTLGVFAWVRKGGRPWVILLTLAAIGLVLGALKILA
jgi:PTS system mannose-specific IID component